MTAKGIVTRMGQDSHRLGGAAIEPGSRETGIRSITYYLGKSTHPAIKIAVRQAFFGYDPAIESKASFAKPALLAGQACAARASGAGQALTIPLGNHGENIKK